MLKRAWLKETVTDVLACENLSAPLEIDCMVTDDPAIRALNLRYRGIDAPTDVLSFALEETGPGLGVFPAPPAPQAVMGILVISYPTAAAQAASDEISVEDEVRLLLVHGVLHILGYDHRGRKDTGVMRKREREILALLKQS